MAGNTPSEKQSFKNAVFGSVFILLPIIVVYLIEKLVDFNFYWLGVYPRKWFGVLGILTSPFKHHDFGHLLNNVLLLSFLLIGFFLHVHGKKHFGKIFLISVICNFWLWIGGRSAWHYGASGLVYGLFFFILVYSLKFKKRELYLFLLSCLILSAGFFIGLFPYNPSVSFEGHIFGSIAGVLVGLFEKKKPLSKERISNINFSRNADFTYHYEEKKNDEIK